MKKLLALLLIGLLGFCLIACDDDDDDGDPCPSNPHADYTLRCDFMHPFSGDTACKGLVGITDMDEAEAACSGILIGGLGPVDGIAEVVEGSCADSVDYNGYCMDPQDFGGFYTFAAKSIGPDVKTNADDCDKTVNLSGAWGCEEGPKINKEPVGHFCCTL